MKRFMFLALICCLAFNAFAQTAKEILLLISAVRQVTIMHIQPQQENRHRPPKDTSPSI